MSRNRAIVKSCFKLVRSFYKSIHFIKATMQCWTIVKPILSVIRQSGHNENVVGYRDSLLCDKVGNTWIGCVSSWLISLMMIYSLAFSVTWSGITSVFTPRLFLSQRLWLGESTLLSIYSLQSRCSLVLYTTIMVCIYTNQNSPSLSHSRHIF